MATLYLIQNNPYDYSTPKKLESFYEKVRPTTLISTIGHETKHIIDDWSDELFETIKEIDANTGTEYIFKEAVTTVMGSLWEINESYSQNNSKTHKQIELLPFQRKTLEGMLQYYSQPVYRDAIQLRDDPIAVKQIWGWIANHIITQGMKLQSQELEEAKENISDQLIWPMAFENQHLNLIMEYTDYKLTEILLDARKWDTICYPVTPYFGQKLLEKKPLRLKLKRLKIERISL